MTKMEPLVERMARLRAEQQKDNLRAVSELASHLRPEQREEMHTILAERYGGGWRGRRGPPRPPE
jgi:Spy/CpxP family protein refolding chaperone